MHKSHAASINAAYDFWSSASVGKYLHARPSASNEGCLSLTRSGIALQLAQIPGIMQQTHCCIMPQIPATSSESIRPSHKRISATITADIFPVGHQELVFT
jgi:hypothetical protein